MKKIIDINKFGCIDYKAIKTFVVNNEEKVENDYYVIRKEDNVAVIYYKRIDTVTDKETLEYISCVAYTRERPADTIFDKISSFHSGVLSAYFDYDFKESDND